MDTPVSPTKATISAPKKSKRLSNPRSRANRLDVRQHANGITQIEGFLGNSLDSMTSIGTAWSNNRGDVIGSTRFTEFERDSFDFGSTEQGTFFQLVIRKTSLSNGYALYRALPDVEEVVVPVPGAALPGIVGLGVANWRLRKRKTA